MPINRAATDSHRLPRLLAFTRMGCTSWLVALAVCLIPGITSAREWTDSTGTFTVDAKFVSLVDGQVLLKCDDGREIRLLLERLSEADQKYVRQQASQAGERPPSSRNGRGRATAGDTTTVVAEGAGTSPDEALKDAFRMAVQAVVGTVVDGETLIENDDLIRDKVLTYSNGFVTTYDRLSESRQDGLFCTRIRATVARNKLIVRLENEKIITRKVEGKGLFAKAVTTLQREKDAAQIMRRVFEGFPGTVLKAEAVGKPRIIEKSEDEATVGITVRFSVDQKAYSQWVVATRPVLEKLAVKHSGQSWSIQRFHRQGALMTIDTPNGQASAWAFAQIRLPWNEREPHVSVDRWGRQSIPASDAGQSYSTLSATGKGLGSFFPEDFREENVLSVLDQMKNGQVVSYQLERGPYQRAAKAVFTYPVVTMVVRDELDRRLLQVERVAFFGRKFEHRFHATVFWRLEYGLYGDQFLRPLPLETGSTGHTIGSDLWSELTPETPPPIGAVEKLMQPGQHILVAPCLIGTGQGTAAMVPAFNSEFVVSLPLDDLQRAAKVNVRIRSEDRLLQTDDDDP